MFALCGVVGPATAVTLMGQLSMVTNGTYTTGNGNHEDGTGIFGQYQDLRCADDFAIGSGLYKLTSVKVGNLGFGGGNALARVRIYADAGGLPGNQLHAGTFAISSAGFVDNIFGLAGNIHTADVSPANWVIGPGKYWVNMQTVSSTDWEYTCRDSVVTGYDSALGDGPNGAGGYGFPLWQLAGTSGFGAGNSAYNIEADLVPEPATMVALALGSAAMVRRRRAAGRPRAARKA
ncbi:MAG: hypothetical protein HONBIEJF_01050 [Fimbriimonadaceae bacterium]|nr:hypothetical protein [Fimbriimonadaceae bacterium]